MIIILNGPAGCGKDTIANRLLYDHGFLVTCFKHDLYNMTATHYGIPFSQIKARNDDRSLKELPWVDGLSVRQMLIHVSEDVCKPKFGKDLFGRLAAARVCHLPQSTNVVFSDGGFIEEALALPSPIVVRLHRDGLTFAGDSRSYLDSPLVKCVDVHLEEGSIDKAVADVLRACRD